MFAGKNEFGAQVAPSQQLGRFALAMIVAALSTSAKAEVSVDPTRVVLEGRTRNAEIALINTGDALETYRIAFKDARMTETGSFETIERAENSAKDMIRFSPRQVTVAPGESQTVRLAVRKPPELAPGEYRSHLVMMAVPREGVPGLQAVYGVSIPVIVRHGDLNAAVSLSGLQLGGAADERHPASLRVAIERVGERSVYGDLEVIHTPPTGQARLIGSVKGIAVYTDIPRRQVVIPLAEAPGRGSLTVIYREQAKDGGDLLAQSHLTR